MCALWINQLTICCTHILIIQEHDFMFIHISYLFIVWFISYGYNTLYSWCILHKQLGCCWLNSFFFWKPAWFKNGIPTQIYNILKTLWSNSVNKNKMIMINNIIVDINFSRGFVASQNMTSVLCSGTNVNRTVSFETSFASDILFNSKVHL